MGTSWGRCLLPLLGETWNQATRPRTSPSSPGLNSSVARSPTPLQLTRIVGCVYYQPHYSCSLHPCQHLPPLTDCILHLKDRLPNPPLINIVQVTRLLAFFFFLRFFSQRSSICSLLSQPDYIYKGTVIMCEFKPQNVDFLSLLLLFF